MVADLRWQTIALEALELAWPSFVAFTVIQVFTLRRLTHEVSTSAICLVAVLSVSLSWATATWLFTVPLPLNPAIAPFVFRHTWLIGVATSLVGFVPTTVAWFVVRPNSPRVNQ